MAKLTGPFTFIGTIGDLSAYKMRGTDKTVLRLKWGPTAEDIQTKPQYDITRRNNREFDARSKGASLVQQVLQPLEPMRDYNLSGPLNGFMSRILKLDTEGVYGRRSLLLSRQARLLEGFNLNRRTPFDGTLRNGVGYTLSRETLSARVELPAFLPGTNFFPADRYPLFRVVAVLGLVPDLFLDNYNNYTPEAQWKHVFPVRAETDWQPVKSGSSAAALELALPYTPSGAAFSLLLGVGISFGTLKGEGTIEPVKYVGSAKVLAMG